MTGLPRTLGTPGYPKASSGNAGTVTSVGLTVPTGLSVSGGPITTAGTLAVTYAAGYQGYTTTEAAKLSGITALADPTGTTINAATAKTTPVDADTMPLTDSAASNALKKVTWANIKATLKTYFDTLYQPLAAKLTALAGQTWATDQITYQTGTSTVGTTALTSFARTLLDDTSQSVAQATLGLVPGTNVQAYDADLATIAGLSLAGQDGKFLGVSGGAFALIAGGGSVNIQTGYIDTTTITTGGSGEDASYINVTISAVSNIAKCDVSFVGGSQQSGSANISQTMAKSGSILSHDVTARLTSTTNLRISAPASNTVTQIAGRWYVREFT